MTDVNASEGNSFVELSLQKVDRIEQAMVHLAKAIELDLVDVALDPSIASNGGRERYALLGSKLAELSGISYELVVDISTATGIAIEGAETSKHLAIEEATTSTASSAEEPAASSTKVAVQPSPQPTPSPSPDADVSSPNPNPADTAPVAESGNTNELFEKIIDLGRMPTMRPVEEAEAISIEVCNNTTIRIKDKLIELTENEVFILNAMLLLRDKPRASSDIRALGFEPKGKTSPTAAFANTIKPLLEKLNRTAGKEIIKKLGDRRSTQYAFNPRAVISELRGTEQELVSVQTAKKN